MKSEIRDVEDVRIIELAGKITIGAGDVKIRELVENSLEEGQKKILLDLAGVTAVDVFNPTIEVAENSGIVM